MKKVSKSYSENVFEKINVLWITAGLGCDGESVVLTSATQPSIEDIVMGGLPGMPEVFFLNPFYSYENADEYLDYLEAAAIGELAPFILVIEGSIPNEDI
jgi:hydrogenase small subunit